MSALGSTQFFVAKDPQVQSYFAWAGSDPEPSEFEALDTLTGGTATTDFAGLDVVDGGSA